MKKLQGFTLIEMLIGMAIFGILMLAFTQIFGGSLKASSQINSRNELVSEGQIAQQLVASRLQGAYYVYPPGTSMQLTSSGFTAKNTVNGADTYTWRVGTNPFIFVAMILPPTVAGTCTSGSTDACFSFYAYYPVLRSVLIDKQKDIAPDADPNNASAWILMEYRANLIDGVDRRSNLLATPPNAPNGTFMTVTTNPATSPNPALPNPTIKGQNGQMLIDYVQPLGAAPYGHDVCGQYRQQICRLQPALTAKSWRQSAYGTGEHNSADDAGLPTQLVLELLLPLESTAKNASCGTSTVPNCFIRSFPFFCFSNSLRLRVMSPP